MKTVAFEGTRGEILILLKKHAEMTVKDLSEALGISTMGVRQHLKILEEEDYIQVETLRKGVGRPQHLYQLSKKGHDLFPSNYETMLHSLLELVRESDGKGKVDQLLRKQMERLVAEHQDEMHEKELKERVAALAKIQETAGYMAVLDESEDGLEITEHHCPVARVAEEYPQMCEYELEYFKQLLETETQRVECMTSGDHACRYVIGT